MNYKKTDSINFSITLNSFRVQIDIENVNETLDLSLTSDENKKYFKEFIGMLFTSFIRIKRFGNYTKITFFNQRRERVKTIRFLYFDGFSLNFKISLKEYPPLFIIND